MMFWSVLEFPLIGFRETSDVSRRCDVVFVANAAFWTCSSSFCVASAAL